ncbi:hypothetical protein D3C72_2515380 [compost metagenome]
MPQIIIYYFRLHLVQIRKSGGIIPQTAGNGLEQGVHGFGHPFGTGEIQPEGGFNQGFLFGIIRPHQQNR